MFLFVVSTLRRNRIAISMLHSKDSFHRGLRWVAHDGHWVGAQSLVRVETDQAGDLEVHDCLKRNMNPVILSNC